MERSLSLAIYSDKPFYKSLSNDSIVQLKLPKDTHDLFNKISAYCLHTTRCVLQLTCKQFYYSASLNNLDNLVLHNFIIGDEKEKAAFFKALIKTSNPKLITPLLQHAKKEAGSYNFENAIQKIDLDDYTQKEYIQNSYLNPLLKEALEQENSIMIDRLKQENINTDIIDDHNNQLTTLEVCLLFLFCCPCLICCGN